MRRVKKEVWILLVSLLALGAVWLITTPSVWWQPLNTRGEVIEALAFSEDGKFLQTYSLKHVGVYKPDLKTWQVFSLSTGEEAWQSNTGPQFAFHKTAPPINAAYRDRSNWIHDFTRRRFSSSQRYVSTVLWRQRTASPPQGGRGPGLIWGPGYVYDTVSQRLSVPLGGTNVRQIFLTPDERQAVVWESGDGTRDQKPGTLSWWD